MDRAAVPSGLAPANIADALSFGAGSIKQLPGWRARSRPGGGRALGGGLREHAGCDGSGGGGRFGVHRAPGMRIGDRPPHQKPIVPGRFLQPDQPHPRPVVQALALAERQSGARWRSCRTSGRADRHLSNATVGIFPPHPHGRPRLQSGKRGWQQAQVQSGRLQKSSRGGSAGVWLNGALEPAMTSGDIGLREQGTEPT
jgi:hypothetical protein